jgi:hypothetical protein
MSKIIDSRLAYDVDLVSFSQKPNVIKEDENGDGIYIVLIDMVYWLLDDSGNRLVKTTRQHEIYPLANPVTGIQFINNLSALAPLIRNLAIADRAELCGL